MTLLDVGAGTGQFAVAFATSPRRSSAAARNGSGWPRGLRARNRQPPGSTFWFCANVGGVPYQVHAEQAAPRVLAAVRAVTTPARLGADIIGLLDQVWPLLREQGLRTGHNVVVYYPASADGEFAIDAGVEVFEDFTERSMVGRVTTPAGQVATTAHYGEYSAMGGAYAALERWCAENGRERAGVNWEIYGDWEDDPARRLTDVYTLLRLPAQ